jgi:co-chaperonin GroES (HSP10)
MNHDALQVKIRAIKDHVIVSSMYFGERKSSGGIILRDDNGTTQGIRARWAKVYKVGPEQEFVKEGQWILVEHGRWTRKIKINDGQQDLEIQRVDNEGILAVSDDAPNPDDDYIGDSI